MLYHIRMENPQMDDLGVPNLWKAPYSGVG